MSAGTSFDGSGFGGLCIPSRSARITSGAFPLDINERGMAVGFIFTAIGGSLVHGAVWPTASQATSSVERE